MKIILTFYCLVWHRLPTECIRMQQLATGCKGDFVRNVTYSDGLHFRMSKKIFADRDLEPPTTIG